MSWAGELGAVSGAVDVLDDVVGTLLSVRLVVVVDEFSSSRS